MCVRVRTCVRINYRITVIYNFLFSLYTYSISLNLLTSSKEEKYKKYKGLEKKNGRGDPEDVRSYGQKEALRRGPMAFYNLWTGQSPSSVIFISVLAKITEVSNH